MTERIAARAPHHDGSPAYRGVVPGIGGSLPVRVHVPDDDDAGRPERVAVRYLEDGEPRLADLAPSPAPGGTWWTGRVPLVNPRTNYRFLLAWPDASAWLTAEGVSRRDVSDRADFVVDASPGAPDWVADQIAYQIFPDRFARSAAADGRTLPEWAVPQNWDDPVAAVGRDSGRQLYGGDLDGIIEHLDYLVDLGVTTLYLTPVFEGHSNHRYDAVSFDRIDPVLGGEDAYRRLIAAAHERGLRVLGDLTTNHTGRHHEWFLAAQADPGGPEGEFYLFAQHPQDYHCWQGHASLPTLNYTSDELRRRMYEAEDSVVAKWLAAGLDGWRIDVANMTGRQHATELNHEVARGVRQAALRVRGDAWLLAEHFFDASGDLRGDGWHGVMDYTGTTFPLWRWLIAQEVARAAPSARPTSALPAADVVATMREVHARYPWDAVTASTLHLDSHDLPRMRTIAGGGGHGGVDHGTQDDGVARTRHLLGAALQLTLPGVPSLFAGDELGLTASTGEHARTPMPWNAPEAWDAATLEAYRSLIALRRAHPALRRGSLRWLSAGQDHLTFVREHAAGRVLVHAVRPRPDSGPPRDGAVRVPIDVLGGEVDAVTLFGEPLVLSDDDDRAWQLPAGVGAHVWRLDGADLAWS